MQKLTLVCRIAVAAVLLGTLQSACGGQSFSSGSDPSGGSGNEGGSGTGSAGSHASAGTSHAGSASAGTSHGGSSVGGSASGGDAGSGEAGTAGAPTNDACTGPSSIDGPGGACTAALPFWTHNSQTGLCMPIIFGGCGGTKNLYKSLEECQKACPGGAPNYDECKLPTDCMLAAAGCCGVCDGPGVTQHDFIAYNKAYAGKVSTCAGDVACGACPPPMADGTLKYFVPDCVQGQCVVEDLRTSAVTACKTDMDCMLRTGHGCCPSCNPEDLLAVRNDGSFENLVCGNIRPPCAACVPMQDSGAIPICGADQHCSVAYVANGATP